MDIADVSRTLNEVSSYAELKYGLDPIGSSDMLMDLSHFTQRLLLTDEYESPEKTWALFAEQVIKPVYGLDLT